MDARTPEPLVALWLAEEAARRGGLLVHVARSDARLDRLLGPAQAFAGATVEVLPLPGWDVLPYDPARPSAAVIGQRVGTLLALAQPAARPRLVLTSADAVLRRVPPPRTWEGTAVELVVGDALDLEVVLRRRLAALGYCADEEIHESGEAALRGGVVDLWPAGDPAPVRLDVADGRIAAMHRFDPVSQRTTGAVDRVRLLPAIEFPAHEDEDEDKADLLPRAEEQPPPPEPPARLVSVFDLLPGAGWVLDPEVEERWHAFAEQAEDAYAATSKARRVAAAPGSGRVPRPRRLYVGPEEAERAVAGGRIEAAPEGTHADAPRSSAALVVRLRGAEGAVVLACPGDPAAVVRSLARRGIQARAATDWQDARAGGVAAMQLDVVEGFERGSLLLLPIASLVRAGHTRQGDTPALEAETGPRIGDLAVHAEHGVGRLRGLTQFEGGERVALEYAGGADLLAEHWDLAQIWRLGGEAARMAPDHLGGDAWQRTRAELETEVEAAAERLAGLADARARETAPRIEAGPAYARLARRFAFAPSRDQQAAFDAVLADLAAGRPMNRLVCGDVGFGKTEVALRAAAAAALAGWQVAIAAPTTVLARQHLDRFRRRFAGTEIRVEGLIRGAATPAGRRVRRGLADGSIGVAVGTQALAAEGIRFKRLGLVVVDEEQRFGEAVKTRLASLGGGAHQVTHLLTMTATPIPRTLQEALVGLRDCSVIATAPVRRQPTRTFVLPWDPVVAREALLREKARGGQSFVVVPRIEALRRVETELRELVPELELRVAHGKLAPEALDEAVAGFAQGEGDVLLATNIIEAGLDIPRANLILVREAERFGLAQLHQLRGRVGRGPRRGGAYFMTAPGRRLAPPTQARLRTLEVLSDLGAGAALSVADLDLRGGGDLFGRAQAGHLRRVGTEMYQELLAQALAARRGIALPPSPASLRGASAACLPAAWVPEANLRLALLRRLARLDDPAALEDFAEELTDRFGEQPPDAVSLLDQARLRLLAGAHGISNVEIGPKATALTFRLDREGSMNRLIGSLGGKIRNGRAISGVEPAALIHFLEEYLPI